MSAPQQSMPSSPLMSQPVFGVDSLGNPLSGSGGVGAALPAYGSNPSQTAASGADTQYKWGSDGKAVTYHQSIQNNTAASVFYAFDQSTTGAGNPVYVLSPNQLVAWDRVCTILHFSSAAQQTFGGTTGITVEAFA